MKKLKITLCFIALLIVILSCMAFTSTYYTTLNIKVAVQGPTRYYNGQNLQYSATTSVDWHHKTNHYYTVALYRKNFIGASYIGSKNLLRDGHGIINWSNIGPGNYYTYTSKANDDVRLTSDNVIIRNYYKERENNFVNQY